MFVAGVDEAGRGPLVGSVVAAAVILDPNNPIEGLNDSKKLTEKKREKLFIEIKEKALAWSIAEATHTEIDEMNILQATFLAMRRAVENLKTTPHKVIVDGNQIPKGIEIACEAIVGGDATHAEISAASILAKVTRDHQMKTLDELYPDYGFAKHKGYPTAAATTEPTRGPRPASSTPATNIIYSQKIGCILAANQSQLNTELFYHF